MTPHIAKLSARLADINAHAERLPPSIDNSKMAAELRKMQAYMNQSANGAGAPRDRIKEAVSDFQNTGDLPDAKAARLVCWGITETAVQNAPILIEDQQRFPHLLQKVDLYRDDLKPYRRCWRGLLNGYFSYDTGQRQAGRNNWELLREYLWKNQDVTNGSDFRPDWAITMAEHLNLLTKDPCSRYGRALFEGDDSILDPLRRDLSLNDSSWLMRALVDAQLSDTIGRPDQEFKGALPKLLSFLGKHETLQDSGLARVLNRYWASASHETHLSLRDHTVGRWGNPWLQANDMKWAHADASARKMIASWLKLDFIQTFFSLLSSDQMNDQRRLKFWARYVDDIEDMYFVLGKAAANNQNHDFVKARGKMSGRWLRLESTNANNNAFVMTIRNRVFVEFGETGNALYVFDRDKLPFDLRRQQVSDGTHQTGLKSRTDHVGKMSHTDHSQTWEVRCEQLIYNLTGILPKSGARPLPVQRTTTPGVSPPAARSASAPQAKVNDTEIFAFLAARKIRYDDLRQRGGSLWVYAPQFGGDLPLILRQWNFIWVDRRHAWYWKQ